ncbi:MAG TPA: hypothetical protein VE131_08370, partial [Terriglobales bacterium]|nr:hypothetical protein [Terriglobales bacterium]
MTCKKSDKQQRFQCLGFLFVGLLSFGAFAGVACSSELQLDTIKLPPGFKISLYAEVPGARSMTLSPNGILFVGTRGEGKVYAIRMDDKGSEPVVIAQGLNMPNGVAFRSGALYVAEVSRVLRYDNIESKLNDPPKPVTVNDDFPSDRSHGWKFIAF